MRKLTIAVALAIGVIALSATFAIATAGALPPDHLRAAKAASARYHSLERALAANGKLELVGVEYFAAALANTESGPAPWFGEDPPPLGFFNPAPVLFGQTFDGPMAGHAPDMPWHYDLHVWLWRDNPDGLFAMWNPNVALPGSVTPLLAPRPELGSASPRGR